jgi:HEAT repeat protein
MVDEITPEKRTLDLGGDMPSIEGVETDEELLLARDLTSAFIKTIKTYRFYPADNPNVKGFREQLVKKMQFFLNKFQSFALQIGEYDMSFKGRILYENRDIKASLAFLLYKDGLRELRFSKGVEEWEVHGLVDLIKRTDNINQLEDDLVTLIWEKDFPHISYLATDEFLEETPVIVPENIDQFRKHLVFKPVAHHVEVDPLEGEAGQEVDINEFLARAVQDPPFNPSNRSVYFLTPDEVEGLRKEVETEVDPTFVFNITDIIFEILAIEKEREAFQDAANILGKVLDALLTLGEFRKAGDLLKRIYFILKIYDLKDWQIEIIRQLIESAGDDLRIERIGRVLEREEGIRLEEMSAYLNLLQRNSIKPLVKLLGELKNSKTRRVICDSLSEIGKNAIELFVPFIADRRWFLVRNITYILGRIGQEQALPYIQKAFNHDDVRVRREAIQAFGIIGGSKAVELLASALSDEDVRIRSMAAINLGKVGKTAGLIPLLEAVQSKEIQRKESAEIKSFFNAIGMVGSNEAIPVLQQILERKSWLGRGTTDEMRLGAANALAMIGSSESKAILETGKDSKDAGVRTACLRALKTQPR